MDLEELAGVLEGDPVMGGGRIDVQTGEVWPQSVLEYAEEVGDDDVEDEDDDERWLRVHCEGSRAGYLLDRWYGFTDDRHRGRARAWLVAEGYTPALPQREP